MMIHEFDLEPEDARRHDALIDAVVKLEARGLRIVNVKIPRSLLSVLYCKVGAPYLSKPPTFRGYPIKVVED